MMEALRRTVYVSVFCLSLKAQAFTVRNHRCSYLLEHRAGRANFRTRRLAPTWTTAGDVPPPTASERVAAAAAPAAPRKSSGRSALFDIGALLAIPVASCAVLMHVCGVNALTVVAGGLSCSFAHGIATPLDVIKTRMQTNPELYDGCVTTAFRRIVRAEGPMFLWQGLAPTVVGYFLEGGLKIGVYELIKGSPLVMGSGPVALCLREHPVLRLLLAGAVSGVVASAVLCPVEDARIRMVAQPDITREVTCEEVADVGEVCTSEQLSGLDTSLKLYKEEGARAVYDGFGAMLLKQVPYTVSKQCSFDALMTAALTAPAVAASSALLLVARLGAAAVSAILSCLTSQPGDVLLTALYKDSAHSGSLREVVAQGGGTWRALFVGTKARLLHVGFLNTMQLVTYDMLRVAFGLGSSGIS